MGCMGGMLLNMLLISVCWPHRWTQLCPLWPNIWGLWPAGAGVERWREIQSFSENFIDCTFLNIIFLQQMYGTRSPALSLWCAGRGTRWRTDHDWGRGAGTGNGNMTRSDHKLKYARALDRSLMKWIWKMFKWLLSIKLCMLCLFYWYLNFLQEVHYNEQCKRLYSNL